MQKSENEETSNVLSLALLIAVVLIVFTFATLLFITKDLYLTIYYVIESFFGSQNTSAAFDLADMMFLYKSFTALGSAVLFVVAIIANFGRLFIMSFIIAAVVSMVGYANIDIFLNSIKKRGYKNHIIICGYNRIAEELIAKLSAHKKKFIVLDQSPENVAELSSRGIVAFSGDLKEPHIYELANISKSGLIIFDAEDDLLNFMGALTARKLNSRIKTFARVSRPEVRTKMFAAGIDMCVLPEYLAGIEIGDSIVKALRSRA
ncbi:MAG: NAD-binding protein [Candidatus Micrarchaeaceae archaeon]